MKKKDKKNVSLKTPGTFFRNIGIKLQGEGEKELRDAENAIRSLGNRHFLESFYRLLDQPGDDHSELLAFLHSDLRLAKILYGVGFHLICAIAEELRRLPIPPNSRILDVGGGPGHLAFWMAHIWPECSITVADKYPALGTQWAKEIGESRVTFADAVLPDLAPLESQQFDYVILSRVLSFMLRGKLHRLRGVKNAFSTESYLNSQEVRDLLYEMDRALGGVSRVLKTEGSVVVIEEISLIGPLITPRAFRNIGFSVNFELSYPAGNDYPLSTFVFSKSPPMVQIQDVSAALSTVIGFGDAKYFLGTSAESIRTLFQKVQPTMVLEMCFERDGSTITEINEVLEWGGLMLFYTTTEDGDRRAILTPATEIPKQSAFLEERERHLVANANGKVIRRISSD